MIGSMQIDSSSALHRLVPLLSHNAFLGGFEREQKYIVHRFFLKNYAILIVSFTFIYE